MKEALIVLALLAFGLICFPALIYAVGQRIIGDYEGGMLSYYESIAEALAVGNGFAWILVFSPYLGVQLLRFGLWVRRQRPGVN
jgi:hypothetical protein